MTDRQRRRYESILDAAAKLLGERSPESVTMDEVASRSGVAKGTLYLYFESKDALLRELIASHLDGLATAVEETARIESGPRRLRLAVEAAFRFQLERPNRFRLRRRAECSARIRTAVRENQERYAEAIREAVRAAGFGESLDRDAELVRGTIEAAVESCLENGRDANRQARALWRFVRRGLGAGELAGRTVLVTREEPQDGPLVSALRERGAEIVHVPLLETLPPENPEELRAEAEKLASYDWVFLTSAKAARALSEVAPSNGKLPRFAVVGEGTASRTKEAGWEPALVGRNGAVELVRTLERQAEPLEGRHVLFPASERVRPEGIRELERVGARVRVVTAYRTVERTAAGPRLAGALAGGAIDVVAFTSPSGVEAFAETVERSALPPGLRVAAIGATTEERLRSLGFENVIRPERPELDTLAAAIATALGADEE